MKVILYLAIIAVSCGMPFSSSALKFSTVLEHKFDVITDPLGLKKSTGNVLNSVREACRVIVDARAAIADLDRLGDKTNAQVKARLEQLEGIIEFSRDSAVAVIDRATSQIRALEKEIYNDINAIIRNSECAAMRTVKDVVDSGIKNFRFISKDKREYRLPFGQKSGFWPWSDPKPLTIDIDLTDYAEPSLLFAKIEVETIVNLALASADDSPFKVISAYEGIARLARNTQCHYFSQPSREIYERKAAYYSYLAKPWVDITPTDRTLIPASPN